jgi:hypothetical protein
VVEYIPELAGLTEYRGWRRVFCQDLGRLELEGCVWTASVEQWEYPKTGKKGEVWLIVRRFYGSPEMAKTGKALIVSKLKMRISEISLMENWLREMFEKAKSLKLNEGGGSGAQVPT